jgi:hypothetical protein
VEKIRSKIWDIYLYSIKLPIENNRPKGKNSPNLVTLSRSDPIGRRAFLF